MLNLVWVRTFLSLIEHKSFQVAADHLRIAQPTASSHIQKLEEQLGAPLFHRSRTGCEPTREAMSFLPYAQSILRVNERALAAVTGRRLRVGASSNIGIYLLQPYIRSYLECRDSSAFDIVIDRNPSIAEKLENVEIDVAVLEWWDDRVGCQAECWKSEPAVIIVPPDHPLAFQTRIDRAQLSKFELLGGEPGTGTRRMLANYFGDSAQVPRVSLQLGSTEAVKQAVKAGLGISLVLASAVSDEVRAGSLRAIPFVEPPLRKDLFVAWRTGISGLPIPAFARHLLNAEGHCGALSAAPSAIEADPDARRAHPTR
ncbi:LysR family transcriptional regulator [Ancylobacter aquaticus]|nr:LysR family transcriptional regulator [Ancylobacter aquaticus]